MQWENLTSPDFARAVKETGVCIIALGVLERHGEHLPLGTDFINGHHLACLAAEQVPAVVFPPWYFGQIYEARCYPGALTIKPTLLIELLRGVFDEIGRNGFKKIILLNAHGGNMALLPFLAQCSLWEQKPYSLYYYTQLGGGSDPAWKEILDTEIHMHACECETSISLANHPHLVHMDRIPANPTTPLGRLGKLEHNMAGIGWYANFPEHYAGDARPATAEKGEKLQAIQVAQLAKFIAAVKADAVVPALEQEFFERGRF
ncbi:MAG: creatininase family protein [Chloroflexota bacterium]|nr:MAG: creatininase family protein [Chloroflexota bacterium]